MKSMSVRRRAGAATGDKPSPTPHPRPTLTQKSPRRPRRTSCMRRVACVVVAVLLVSALMAVPVLLSIFRGTKPPEEMWMDWKAFASWRLSQLVGKELPCTYAGVRFFQWGEAVASPASDCGCWLRRCVPSAAGAVTTSWPTSATSEAVDVLTGPQSQDAPPLTVQAIRDLCRTVPAYAPKTDLAAAVRAAWLPTTPRASSQEDVDTPAAHSAWLENPLFHRITYPNGGAATDGAQIFATVPTCVQSGRVYFDVPAPAKTPIPESAVDTPGDDNAPAHAHQLWNAFLKGEIDLDDSPLLKQFECRAGEHIEAPHVLSDLVLQRAAKYHPVTAVRALGLLVDAKHATSDLLHLVEDVLVPFQHLLAALAGAERAHGVEGTSPPWVPFEGWQPEMTQSWLHSARQVLLVEDQPDTEDISFPSEASSRVARALAHSFSTNHRDAALFDTAPVSRVRYGEKSREPMYCFCQSLVVPSTEPLARAEMSESAIRDLRHRLNDFFGALPLSAQVHDNVVITDEARRAADPERGSRFWPLLPAPTSAGGDGSGGARRAPRLLYLARDDRRVSDEARLLQLLAQVGFAVEVVRVDRNDVPTTPMTAADWFHAARYADVVMGMHGPGLTHAMWMDNTHKKACRTLVELLPFADAEMVSGVYSDAMAAAGVRYRSVAPVDVRIGEDGLLSSKKFTRLLQARRGASRSDVSAAAEWRKVERLRRTHAAGDASAHTEFDLSTADSRKREQVEQARRALTSNPFGPFGLPSFYDQTAVYNSSTLAHVVREVHEHLTTCLSS